MTKLHPRAPSKTEKEGKTERFRQFPLKGRCALLQKESCALPNFKMLIFLHRDDVISPVPPTRLEKGWGDGSTEEV